MDKVVVVYSGRFQPFHKGHYATYDHLVKKFGKDNVYIGTSNTTDSKKSPFNFKEKKVIMTTMFGIPSNKIVNIRNPYAPEEILNKFDSDTTGFITVVGEKDSSRLSGKYFKAYKGKVDTGYLDRGYVYAAPAQPNPISGTDVRYWLSAGNAADRKKGFIKAYPKFDDQVFKLITLKLKSLKEYINEEIKLNVKVGDTLLMGKFKNKKVVVKNIGTDEWGMPTINGKKAVTFRIPKKEELKEAASNAGMQAGDEPDTSFVADGQPRILNTNKPENWYKQGGYTQLDTPKADDMRGKGKSKDTETQFRKAYYKLKNVVQSTLNPADDPHKVEDWEEVYRTNPEQKPKRFWELPKNQKPQIISKDDINEIINELEQEIMSEMGLPGGAGVGLSLPGGYINGAPNSKDVKKLKSKLDKDGSEEYEKVKEDKIPGGKAEGMTLIDIAKKWAGDYYDYRNLLPGIKQEFIKGYAIEREHTTDTNIAKEIALDHLYEDPNYYSKLSKIEIPTNEAGFPMGYMVAAAMANKNLKKKKELELEKLKLTNQAFKLMPNSPAQLKVRAEIDKINKEIDRLKIGENINESLLVEGGAYGHMAHPFDIEMGLTFGDLKQIVVRALNGDLELAREKTDGQALAVSWVNGRLVAARNKSHLKNKGAGAMTIGQVADKFAGRGGLTDAYNFAMQDLSKAIAALSEPQRKKIFKDGSSFMNLEVIYPTSVNVIPYNQPLLVFHGTFDYDVDGTIVGENQQAASILGGMIKQVNAHVDIPTCLIFDRMYNRFPKAKFINITRPLDAWLASMKKMNKNMGHDHEPYIFEEAYCNFYLNTGKKKIQDLSEYELTEIRERHLQKISNFFNGKDNYLEVSLTDPEIGTKIREFIGGRRNIPFPSIDTFREERA